MENCLKYIVIFLLYALSCTAFTAISMEGNDEEIPMIYSHTASVSTAPFSNPIRYTHFNVVATLTEVEASPSVGFSKCLTRTLSASAVVFPCSVDARSLYAIRHKATIYPWQTTSSVVALHKILI
ncbi:MAG: hypothetical protein RR279_06580 [Alistipes sp.]